MKLKQETKPIILEDVSKVSYSLLKADYIKLTQKEDNRDEQRIHVVVKEISYRENVVVYLYAPVRLMTKNELREAKEYLEGVPAPWGIQADINDSRLNLICHEYFRVVVEGDGNLFGDPRYQDDRFMGRNRCMRKLIIARHLTGLAWTMEQQKQFAQMVEEGVWV